MKQQNQQHTRPSRAAACTQQQQPQQQQQAGHRTILVHSQQRAAAHTDRITASIGHYMPNAMPGHAADHVSLSLSLRNRLAADTPGGRPLP